uniref:Uncharacterized protein n=1 Tax=Buteo japonicus TaxID=224669 RepID=A0A8C0HPK1_9AVES
MKAGERKGEGGVGASTGHPPGSGHPHPGRQRPLPSARGSLEGPHSRGWRSGCTSTPSSRPWTLGQTARRNGGICRVRTCRCNTEATGCVCVQEHARGTGRGAQRGERSQGPCSSCCRLGLSIRVHSKEMFVRVLLSVDHGAAPFGSGACNL